MKNNSKFYLNYDKYFFVRNTNKTNNISSWSKNNIIKQNGN